MTPLSPIRREVLVDADPTTAFAVFTASLGSWWPLADLSVFGAEATVSFAGDQIVEISADGEKSIWGTVSRWESSTVVAFSWHPGRSPQQASQVEVTFRPAGEQTLVTLSHSGWEVFAEPEAARDEYGSGWVTVLGLFQNAVGAAGSEMEESAEPDEAPQTWVALLHRPGPAAPQDASLFDDPRIGEHFAFLGRMQAAGYLVAAGPLSDELGAGLTVLRLPGDDQLAEATRLATQDDISVVGEFLTVTVRPWQVMLHS